MQKIRQSASALDVTRTALTAFGQSVWLQLTPATAHVEKNVQYPAVQYNIDNTADNQNIQGRFLIPCTHGEQRSPVLSNKTRTEVPAKSIRR